MNLNINFLMIFILPLWSLGFVISKIDSWRSKVYAVLGAATFSFYSLKIFHDLRETPLRVYDMSSSFPNWFDFSISIDGFGSILMVLNAAFLLIITLCRSSKKLKNHSRFYFQLYLITWTSTLALFVTDIFSYIVILELTFLQFLLLVALNSKNESQLNLKSIIINYSIGFFCSFCAILILKFESQTGNSHLTIGYLKEMASTSPLHQVIFCMLVISFIIKMGMFPFHGWLIKMFKEGIPETNLVYVGFVGKMGYIGLVKFVMPSLYISSANFSNILCALGVLSAAFSVMALWQYKDRRVKGEYLFGCGMALSFVGVFALDVHANLGGFILFNVYSLLIAGMIIVSNETEANMLQDIVEERNNTKLLFPFVGVMIGLPGLLVFVGEIVYIYGVASKSVLLALGSGVILTTASIGVVAFTNAHFGKNKKVIIITSKSSIAALMIMAAMFIGFGCLPKILVDRFWMGTKTNYEITAYHKD